MLHLDLLSALPALLESPLAHGIARRAQEKVCLKVHDLRQYSDNKHHKIDDYPYGGGAGMVLSVAPIHACLQALKKERAYDEIILLSPGGTMLTQTLANTLSLKKNIAIICGHYAGVDARVQAFITQEISIGNYVLSGGEAAAWVLCDALIRLLPGVLHDGQNALDDTFQHQQLAPPVYTRPRNYQGMEVPKVLLSGNAQHIQTWRDTQAQERTKQCRPDLLDTDLTDPNLP